MPSSETSDPGAQGARAASTADRWRAQATHDLDDARYAADGARHALACFLTHQAAEKAVTAYLYARGAEQVWGHGLADLCEDAMALDPSFDLLKSIAVHLDKHFLGARYPSTIPAGVPSEAYDETDSNRAIATAEEVLRFVDAHLEALASSEA